MNFIHHYSFPVKNTFNKFYKIKKSFGFVIFRYNKINGVCK